MRKTKYPKEVIADILAEAEQGMPISELCQRYGISAPTIYDWRSKYGRGAEASVADSESLYRSNKGKQTIRKIVNSAVELINSGGLVAASQDNIAKKAGISQSTLRHYFSTKDALTNAVFVQVFEGFKRDLLSALDCAHGSSREKIVVVADRHLTAIMEAPDGYSFESMAYMTRAPAAARFRDELQYWLLDLYAGEIHSCRPDLTQETCRDKAFFILNLIVGAWNTISRSREDWPSGSKQELKQKLLSHIEEVVER